MPRPTSDAGGDQAASSPPFYDYEGVRLQDEISASSPEVSREIAEELATDESCKRACFQKFIVICFSKPFITRRQGEDRRNFLAGVSYNYQREPPAPHAWRGGGCSH